MLRRPGGSATKTRRGEKAEKLIRRDELDARAQVQELGVGPPDALEWFREKWITISTLTGPYGRSFVSCSLNSAMKKSVRHSRRRRAIGSRTSIIPGIGLAASASWRAPSIPVDASGCAPLYRSPL